MNVEMDRVRLFYCDGWFLISRKCLWAIWIENLWAGQRQGNWADGSSKIYAQPQSLHSWIVVCNLLWYLVLVTNRSKLNSSQFIFIQISSHTVPCLPSIRSTSYQANQIIWSKWTAYAALYYIRNTNTTFINNPANKLQWKAMGRCIQIHFIRFIFILVHTRSRNKKSVIVCFNAQPKAQNTESTKPCVISVLFEQRKKKECSFINTHEKCVRLYINKCKQNAMCCHVNSMEIFEWPWPLVWIDAERLCRPANGSRGSCACPRASRGCCNKRPSHALFTRFVVVHGAGTQRTHHPNCITYGFKAVRRVFRATDQRLHLMKRNRAVRNCWWTRTVWRLLQALLFCRQKKESNEMLFKSSILLCKCSLLPGF